MSTLNKEIEENSIGKHSSVDLWNNIAEIVDWHEDFLVQEVKVFLDKDHCKRSYIDILYYDQLQEAGQDYDPKLARLMFPNKENKIMFSKILDLLDLSSDLKRILMVLREDNKPIIMWV